MGLEKGIIDRVQKAYAGFRERATDKEHRALLEMLERIHRQGHLMRTDESATGIGGSEFSHALAALQQIPPDSKALPTKVEKSSGRPDGEIFGTGKWETLDPGWLEALVELLDHFDDRAPFNTSPQLIAIPNDVTLTISGDWGTGNWRVAAPSEKVGKQMQKLQADYSIHLGDVYYAGTSDQETDNLIAIWPDGLSGSFALNSNHEMYSGGFPYFQQALVQKFTQQQGCSYFALENDNWLIIALDTAYHASFYDLYLKGKICSDQIDWLKSLKTGGKRIMLLSHHEGYDITGENQGSVTSQVIEGLGRMPDVWYWGHLHNAIVYEPKNGFYGRCIGHGSIPYADATELAGNKNVAWYETTNAGDPDIPVRVLNGFASLTLKGAGLEEAFIDENGVTQFSCTPQW